MEWLAYFQIFASIQGIVISFALTSIKNPRNKSVNRVIALLVFVIAGFLFANSQSAFIINYPKLYILSWVLIFLYTPLFYLFLEMLQNPSHSIQKKHLLYLLPAALYFVSTIRYLFIPNANLHHLLTDGKQYDIFISELIALIFNFLFLYKSGSILMKDKKWSEDKRRDLVIFLFVIVLTNLFWLLTVFDHLFINLDFSAFPHILHHLSVSLMVFYFSYFMVKRSEFFSNKSHSLHAYIKDIENIEKEVNRIKSTMEFQKPFTNPEFSLMMLSEMTEIPKAKLSTILNHSLKTNFFDFVNAYRIQEFITIVDNPESKNFSLNGLAEQAGFKSKSTFYKSFKDQTGLTPKEYLKKRSSSYYLE